MTIVGTMYIMMAGLSSITPMGSSVGFVFVTGGLTAALGASGHGPVAGLLERLTIGGFLQCLIVTALILPNSTEVNHNA